MLLLENCSLRPVRRPNIKSPVTIIIGIKCKTGIVVACDSRTTDPQGYVDDTAMKLHVIAFNDGNSGIVAEAGHAEFSSRAVEMIAQLAKDRPLNDYRSLASCAEQAVSELKQKIREQFKGSGEELQRHLEAYSFELMLIHYWEGKPLIFTMRSEFGMATKKDKNYCAIGCGWILADFIISRIDLQDIATGGGIWTAVYAVEEIKKFDSRCGGKTRSAIARFVDGKSIAQISLDLGMDEAIKEAQDFSEKAKTEWKAVVEDRINTVIARRTKNPVKPSTV